MFGKILNFKFTSVSEAKLAASFCSEKFGSQISSFNIVGLNIFIGQTGDLNVSIKFENPNTKYSHCRKWRIELNMQLNKVFILSQIMIFISVNFKIKF